MTPMPRRNLALFTFGAAAFLSGCSREDQAAGSGTTAPAPQQTAPLSRAADAPAAEPAA